MRLPGHIRYAIWDAYKIAQEVDMSPSKEYLLAAHKAQDWIKENYMCVACGGTGKSSGGNVCYPCQGTGVQR